MKSKGLLGAIIRVAVSLLCGGALYVVWMAVFLLNARWGSPTMEIGLWPLAPIVTATGFAVGLEFGGRLTGSGRSKFRELLVWPLIGCAIGAGIIYWFGPMLIVFGMFVAGTASVALREAVLLYQEARA